MPIPISSVSATPAGEIKARSFRESGNRYRELMGLLLGPKDAGKSSNLTTVPKADGKKHVFLTGDSTTRSGIRKFTARRLLAEDPDLRNPIDEACDWLDNNVVVHELTELYDPTDIDSSKAAAKHVLNIFDSVKKDGADGKNGVVAVEHYDVLYSKLGVDLCRSEYGLARDEKVHFQMYDSRASFLDPLDALIETVKCDSLWLVGYGEEDKETLIPTGEFVIGRDGKRREKTEVKVVKALPRWITRRNLVRNSLIRIDLENTRNESELSDGTRVFQDQFFAQVISSKHERFDVGAVKDVTNVGLRPFFDGWWVSK